MSGLLISPTPDRGDDPADLNSLLDRLSRLVHTGEAECRRVGPQGVPAVLAANRAQFYAAMDALGGWIHAFLAAGPAKRRCGSFSLPAQETRA